MEFYLLLWYHNMLAPKIFSISSLIFFLTLFIILSSHIERDFGVTNIKSHIPLILDLADHNYDAGVSFSSLTPSLLTSRDILMMMLNGTKRDGLVKLWIYGTLSPDLFKRSFEASGTAQDIMDPH